MCFNIHSSYPNPLIAKKNIVCYKLLIEQTINESKYIVSPYQESEYFNLKKKQCQTIKEVDKLIPILKSIPIDNAFSIDKINISSIYEGLHSYSNLQWAKYMAKYMALKFDGVLYSNPKVYISIIPKGTEYYYNPVNNEYVSLKLKVYKRNFILDLIHRIFSF